MKIVYVAGPFRGATPWVVEQNVREAEGLGLEVARLGVMPLIPHTNTRFFDGELPDQFWITGTLALLKRCDGIIMTPRWKASDGARAEHDWAWGRIPVFYSIEQLREWVEVGA